MAEQNSFLLVYGSETGQAKALAEQIADKSAEFDLIAKLHCLDQTGKQFNIEEETCMVLVTSTTGDGDPPENASKFLRRIRKKTLASDYLSRLHYTVLALGDTNYNNFCKCGKDMDSRLEQLGAQRFYPTGLADDGVGLEIVIDPWLDGLCPALKNHLQGSNSKVNKCTTREDPDPLSQQITDLSLTTDTPHLVPGQSTMSNGGDCTINHSDSIGSSSTTKNAESTKKTSGKSKGDSDNDDDAPPSIKTTKVENKNTRTTTSVGRGDSGDNTASSSSKTSTSDSNSNNNNVKETGDDNLSVVNITSVENSKSNASSSAAVCNGVIDVNSVEDNSKSALKGGTRTLDGKPPPSLLKSSVESPSHQISTVSNGIDSIPRISDENKTKLDGPSVVAVSATSTETPAVSLKDEKIPDCKKCIVRDSCPSLLGKNLTVPLLAPEFLQAEYAGVVETKPLSFQNGCKLPSAVSDILSATVIDSKVLTDPGALKKTLWLRLNLMDQEVSYSPGDSISVICQNNEDEVQLLLDRLNASELADEQMSLSVIPDTKKRRAAVPPHIHPTTTLRHVLTTCVSIRDVPSKAVLRTLVEYTSCQTEKRRLQELCSKEGAEEHTRCLRETGVSLLDVLYAFPSCHPPVHRVLEFLTRLLPRPYSICSCPETNPNSLDIVFNVVDIPRDCDVINDDDNGGRGNGGGHFYSRRGVCTGWLDDVTSALQQKTESAGEEEGVRGDSSSLVQVPIFFRSNQHFRPPTDISKPLIMVGPGTGVAPFIGFLQQRAVLKTRQQATTDGGEEVLKYGETWLFSGCRHKDRDYLFRDDLEEFEKLGVLNRLCVSFSRDAGSAYRYVQDYMKSESISMELASLLVEQEALVYVCGDAKNMSKDVSAAFQAILVSIKEFSVDEASAFVMKKRLHKTYFEDVWT